MNYELFVTRHEPRITKQMLFKYIIVGTQHCCISFFGL